MADSRTLVALATYNELENLATLVDAILLELPDADVLIVDDNSPDGTGRWCDERSRTEPRLQVLHRLGKLGLGSATIDAMRFAIGHDYDVIVTMDADWSHDPTHLRDLIAATVHTDVAIGSRYIEDGAIEGWPWYRRVLSRWMNTLTRVLLKLPVRDTSGAFRAYRVSKLRTIPLESIHSTGYAYLEEILWYLAEANATFAEVPITFHQRRAGRSKISAGEVAGKIGVLGRLAFGKNQNSRSRQ